MKKLSLIFLVVVTSVLSSSAQDSKPKDSYPYWTISKDVQRVAYKNTIHSPLKIELTNVSSMVSKDVHKKKSESTGNVTTTGFPTWTISKGVARNPAERKEK